MCLAPTHIRETMIIFSYLLKHSQYTCEILEHMWVYQWCFLCYICLARLPKPWGLIQNKITLNFNAIFTLKQGSG